MPEIPVMVNTRSKAHKIGLIFSVVHIALFLTVALYIKSSSDPKAYEAWAYVALIDFPTIPMYLIPKLGSIIYVPYLAHGFLGAILWYFMPRLFMRKDSGGIWNNQKADPDKVSFRYMILGTTLTLTSVWIIKSFESSYLGMILLLLGLYFSMKGRSVLDKIMPQKPWKK